MFNLQLTVLEIPLSLKLSCEDKRAATTVDNRLCNSCETLLKMMVEISRMLSSVTCDPVLKNIPKIEE